MDSSILDDTAREPSSIRERPPEVSVVSVPRGRPQSLTQSHRVETPHLRSANTSSPRSILSQKAFRKRKRFKTREDRYEPKQKSRKATKTDSQRPQKSRKRKSRRKNLQNFGADLMHAFSSQHTGRERLTVSNREPCRIIDVLISSRYGLSMGLEYLITVVHHLHLREEVGLLTLCFQTCH